MYLQITGHTGALWLQQMRINNDSICEIAVTQQGSQLRTLLVHMKGKMPGHTQLCVPCFSTDCFVNFLFVNVILQSTIDN